MAPDPSGGGEISGFGLSIKGIPTWALVIALGFAVGVAISIFVRKPEAMNAILRAEVTELGLHIGEDPDLRVTLLDDARGRLTANRYSDLCVVLVHKPTGPARPRYRLVVDMGRDADTHTRWWAGPAVVEAAEAQMSGCHSHAAGPVKTWEERADQCHTYVHRQWQDGCHAVQIVDVCRGSQDVKWLRCVR